MRSAFRWLAAFLFVAIVCQVGFAGYGAFDAVHKAENGPISKKTLEDAFNAHGFLGTLIVLVMLVLLIVAAAGSLGEYVKWSGGIFLLGILQAVLGAVSTSVPALGFLHALNALAIYAAVALLAHRVWTESRTTAAAPSTSAA